MGENSGAFGSSEPELSFLGIGEKDGAVAFKRLAEPTVFNRGLSIAPEPSEPRLVAEVDKARPGGGDARGRPRPSAKPRVPSGFFAWRKVS